MTPNKHFGIYISVGIPFLLAYKNDKAKHGSGYQPYQF